MSDSREHLEHVEAMKTVTPTELVRMTINGGLASVEVAQREAHEHYGSTFEGVTVNETLVDLYRELAAAETALRNARNALQVLCDGAPVFREAPAPSRKDLGRPIGTKP